MPDLIIAGAGGCGLMAALVAAYRGAEVVVLEKTDGFGGGMALSHRGLRGAGTRFQMAFGVVDSPEAYAAEIMQRNGGAVDPRIVAVLTNVSGRMIEFLADHAGVDFELDDFSFGQSAPRSHTWSSGKAITDHLYSALDGFTGVEIRFESPVRALLTEGDRVVGVRTDTDSLTAEAVLLAAGGFGANRDMLRRYICNADGLAFPGHAGSTGEVIEAAMSLGAAVRHMGSFQPYPAHVGPGKRGLPPGVILSGGIVVDSDGSRFVDETLYPGGLAGAILALPGGSAFEVFDRQIYSEHRDSSGERSLSGMLATGDVVTSDSASGLARDLGIDQRGLDGTLRELAVYVGSRDRFGRLVTCALEPPLYGARIRVALYHTQGGLLIDHHGRVTRADRAPIPGLYAGGGAAAGISGDGMDGYLPGNGLLASLGMGMIAAEHFAGASRMGNHE